MIRSTIFRSFYGVFYKTEVTAAPRVGLAFSYRLADPPALFRADILILLVARKINPMDYKCAMIAASLKCKQRVL